MASFDPMEDPRLLVAAGLVWLDPQRVLVAERGPDARFGPGALELPGGKVEPGESPPTALARELREEWGPAAAELRVGKVAEILHHKYPAPGPEVILCVYHVDARPWARDDRWRERLVLEGGERVHRVRCADLPVARFLAADREFIAAVGRGEFQPTW